MATNAYIKQGMRSEQALLQDLVIESLKMYGQDVYYLPRTIVNEDTILYDDIPSLFASSYRIEMYIENTEGFDGEGDLFTKFGVEIRDQATFIVAKRRWDQTVSRLSNLIDGGRPREGNTYGKDKHPYGRDPLGDDERTSKRTRTSEEKATQYISGIASKRKYLHEIKDMLDESNILED